MQLNGFIKIHRKLIEWEWYQNSTVKSVFLHLLLTAYFKDTKKEGGLIKRGQVPIGYEKLAMETGLTVQRVRTAIKKLKSTGEITANSTNKGTLITIVNYEEYQIKDEELTSTLTNELTNNQQTTNKQLTNNQQHMKNDKNDKNKKEIYKEKIPPSFDEVKNYCQERNNDVDPQKFIDFYSAKGWMIGKNKMKDWKAAVRTWEKNKPQERKYNILC